MKEGETRTKQKQKGFTLVELLVIIGIIGILFAVILIAVDPARRFAEARNAVRRQDVRDIVEAAQEYIKDNPGKYPAGLDTDVATYQILGTDTTGCSAACGALAAASTTPACTDLNAALVEMYLAEIPSDPSTGNPGNTRYAINRTNGNRIEVIACDAELGVSTIRMKR